MKKFMLSIMLALILVCCGWQGYQGFGTAPAQAQPPGYYCDPYYQTCTYNNYYTAPYADPSTQFFYYSIPEIGEELLERHERREHRRHERREFREHERGYYEQR